MKLTEKDEELIFWLTRFGYERVGDYLFAVEEYPVYEVLTLTEEGWKFSIYRQDTGTRKEFKVDFNWLRNYIGF